MWLIAMAGCGRLHFGELAGASDGDGGGDGTGTSDAPAMLTIDLTGVVPYNPNDFPDGVVLGNAPRALAALYAPFPDGFAVAAGRSIIEVHLDGTTTVHDYRPAAANAGGPDEITRLAFGSITGIGPRLWLCSATPAAGDGLFNLTPTWALSRENMTDEVTGIAVDPTGAFDSLGTPTLYFDVGNSGFYRRDGAASRTQIYFSNMVEGSVATTATHLFTVSSSSPQYVYRINAMTWVSTIIDTSTTVELADGGGLDPDIVAVRDQHDIVRYHVGAIDVVASAPDVDTKWVAVSVPRAPHPLAGRVIVLESNRLLNRDRLVVLP